LAKSGLSWKISARFISMTAILLTCLGGNGG